jgi:hypothetical protein
MLADRVMRRKESSEFEAGLSVHSGVSSLDMHEFCMQMNSVWHLVQALTPECRSRLRQQFNTDNARIDPPHGASPAA